MTALLLPFGKSINWMEMNKYDDYDYDEEEELDNEINSMLKRKRLVNQKRLSK